MRLKLFESTNLFLIYRDKYGLFAYTSIVGLFTFAIGCVFAFIGWGETGNLPFKVFGGTFIIAGLACLFSIKRLASSIYKSLGLPVLSISKDQLIVYPGIGSSSATYRWHQVQKIVIVGKLFSEDSDGPTKHNNQVVIFFNAATIDNSTFSNLKDQRSTSKAGAVYLELPFPDRLTIQQVKNAIINVCPLANVETQDELRLI